MSLETDLLKKNRMLMMNESKRWIQKPTTENGISDNNSGNQVHNNLPPFYALSYIIKC